MHEHVPIEQVQTSIPETEINIYQPLNIVLPYRRTPSLSKHSYDSNLEYVMDRATCFRLNPVQINRAHNP